MSNAPGLSSPSLVDLAADALRRLIIEGELRPGDRVIENRLTQQLGISRPPLREAMRILEHQGLIRQVPRRGAVVAPLTLHDVYEIFTLRRQLERMAVELAMPVSDGPALSLVLQALSRMEEAAKAGDGPAVSVSGFDFHVAFVGLSGHGRLVNAYRSLQIQMLQCMGLNREARARKGDDLLANVERHQRLVDVVRGGDREAVHRELAQHGDLTFVADLADTLEPGSSVAQAWAAGVAAGV